LYTEYIFARDIKLSASLVWLVIWILDCRV